MANCILNGDLVLDLELRLFIVPHSIHLRDILEHFLAFLQFIDAIEVPWGFRHPIARHTRYHIQGNGKIHEIERVLTDHRKEEYPDDLAEALGDHDHCADLRLVLLGHVLHQHYEPA